MKKMLDWSDYKDQGMGDAYADIPREGGDFAKAVAVCIRSGVCQKTDNRGVMCPSYRINPDKIRSPGGRAALLKEVLNREDNSFLTDPVLEDALESCVSCKGCKRECENNLDMAAIRAEYLAQKKQAGQKSIRSWLFAWSPYLLYRYPLLNQLIRLRNRSELLAALGSKLFGINPHIPMPQRSPLSLQFPAPAQSAQEQRVILLTDLFTALFNPEAARDCHRLLQAAGYQVLVLHPGSVSGRRSPLLDSGRSLFSQGYTDDAREQARVLIRTLLPYVQQGYRIIGPEPSSLLMLRDEFRMLIPGTELEAVAARTLLLEEFIAREHKAGRFRLQFRPLTCAPEVLVHGHCHQKATGAMKSMRKALRLIPDLPFRFLDVSCCGMAGSFGLETRHAEEARAMAEQALLPELDNNPEALVISNGFSCGHQILAMSGRRPVHLASLLVRHMKTDH